MCIEGGKNWQTPSEKCSEGWEYENNTNCAQIKNANDCAKENLCGWCASSSVTSKDSNGKCLYGDIFCPYSDQCDGAGWYYDNITKCSQFSSSEGCSNYSSQFHQECDWNENSEKCEDKSSNALLIGVIGVVGVGALAGGGVAVYNSVSSSESGDSGDEEENGDSGDSGDGGDDDERGLIARNTDEYLSFEGQDGEVGQVSDAQTSGVVVDEHTQDLPAHREGDDYDTYLR
ncbi:hypothetical protein ADUPG1_011332 [Aduncisulcus paluster]|uniref:Uncharacterized protein n=1 Tax=Aduncisulcus paluster TaxID=2918883 RepID=A0ABQ5JZ31_9EUKA|nr:hypothetical protein ADUPG1_011332 [Aduncisulcus paluster]